MDISSADRCVEFLKAEGFRPSLGEDGCVRFKFEGGHYVVQFDPGDSGYVRLIYPCFWPLRTEDEIQRAFAAANSATRATKAAKVFVVPDPGRADVSASIDLFVQNPEQFEAVLTRCLSAIQSAATRFAEQMRVPNAGRAGSLAPWPGGEGPAVN